MLHISHLFNKAVARYENLPQSVRQSALPWIIISLPVTIASLFGAYIVMPLMMLLSTVLLYMTTTSTDHFIFSLSKTQCRLGITMPLCIFINLWAIALALLSRKEMMLGIVGPYTLLLLIAAAPAYRWKESRSARRVPLIVSFSVAGILAFLASAIHILPT